MKSLFLIVTAIILLDSCGSAHKESKAICLNCNSEEEMYRQSEELQVFDKEISRMYRESEVIPDTVIVKTDALIKRITAEPDTNHVRWNKLSSLYDLRAEVFYKTGRYQNSIAEVENERKNNIQQMGCGAYGNNDHIVLACNYVKLGNLKLAKQHIDSSDKGYYARDYVTGNFYELTGEKEKALQIYQHIIADKSRTHYNYYRFAVARIRELNTEHPIYLTGLYFPTSDPEFDTDHTK